MPYHQNPNSLANLVPPWNSETGSIAGKKSVIAKRKYKEQTEAIMQDLPELVNNILQKPLYNGEKQEFTTLEDAQKRNLSIAEAIVSKQSVKALKGDVQAANFLFDWSGQKPAAKQSTDVKVNTGEVKNILNQLVMKENKKNKDNT